MSPGTETVMNNFRMEFKTEEKKVVQLKGSIKLGPSLLVFMFLLHGNKIIISLVYMVPESPTPINVHAILVCK